MDIEHAERSEAPLTSFGMRLHEETPRLTPRGDKKGGRGDKKRARGDKQVASGRQKNSSE